LAISLTWSSLARAVNKWAAAMVEAKVTDTVAISAFDGHRRIAPGRYRVSVLHDEGGNTAGAELMRIDVEGPPWPIRLTAAQWGLLDGTRYFERR